MIRVFTSGRHSIMAGCAVINDTGMIEHRVDEGTGIMAYTAILIGRHMRACLSYGEYTIVAGCAIIHNAGMIKRCR